jgi:hypothetical protein
MEYNWRNTAQAFNMMARPETYMAFGLQGRGQDINIAQANIANRMAQAEMIGGINLGQYNAMTGQAQTGYGVAQEGIKTNLARDTTYAKGVGDVANAFSSAAMSGANAYSQYATAAGASTTPMSSGFYRGEVGAANAMNVAPSQISYQKPTGGFLGIGGQKGGFYYNPSGPYGR